ncbi:TetR/AcrR family transcriptional regulator [Microbacterium sp. cf332]|uniref:TetR/AcrR family transcriptional regulator n=1 Tax=Microbacterium sp. cf332 TaxID=1761804 RepID=UPI0008880D52|nr:TetR/AcrR family transcriptional regulator [Microbacterium sp. cf332]SDQ76150.1 transcriptional regulator, TetR family [Microbacterium sp. cf332]
MTDAPRTTGGALVAAAVALFDEQGYERTSVDDIARAAGMSRSTFFRQYGGKDDVVFADHDVALASLRDLLDAPHESPWRAVCDAVLAAFDHFAADLGLARRRYRVVRGIPSLRDREIVTVFRYERLFAEHLRAHLPGLDPADAVAFSAAATAVHNHVLRRAIRGDDAVSRATLESALDDLLHRFAVHPEGEPPAPDDVVVAVFPRRMPVGEVARRLRDDLS